MEYDNAAMIPGIISSNVHRKTKRTISRYATRAVVKLLKPWNICSSLGSLSLEIAREKIVIPSAKGPPTIRLSKPKNGATSAEPAMAPVIKKYRRNVPTAIPHFPFREALPFALILCFQFSWFDFLEVLKLFFS